MLTEEKFYEKLENAVLLKSVDGKLCTIEEYKTKVEALQKDKNDNIIIPYASDLSFQDSFVEAAKAKSYEVLVFDHPIDSHFIGRLEQKLEKVQFKRVDSDSAEKLIDKDTKLESVLNEDESKKIKDLFENTIGKEGKTYEIEALGKEDMPVSLTTPEFLRRMKEMSASSGMGMGMMGDSYTVVINGNHKLIQQILTSAEEKQKELVQQAFDIALLSQGKLTGTKLTQFLKRSLSLIG
jgi:molecular chaperone HtpG